jgi:hypothetical protein
MTTQLQNGNEYIDVNGSMVEVKSLRIAEAIDDYDSTLRIICVDPTRASFTEAPFVIAQVCPDGVMRKIFEVWELDERVLSRIESADTTRHDIEARIDWTNAEANKEAKCKYEEKILAFKEIGESVLRSKKSSFSYKDGSDLVTIHENRPSVRTSV